MQYFFERFLFFFENFLFITLSYQNYTFLTPFLNNRFIHIYLEIFVRKQPFILTVLCICTFLW